MLENENRIEHIYDKIFKKVLTLSSVAVTNLINGLFNTDYPPKTSTVTYNWTEFHDEKLRKTLADTIVTINGEDAYHMEAQMTSDKDIVFRVFHTVMVMQTVCALVQMTIGLCISLNR